jgi:DNA-directed RNA polymerase specialized sigma24 family protein
MPPAVVMRHLDECTLEGHVVRLYRAAWGLCGLREDAEKVVEGTRARVLASPRFLRNDNDLARLRSVLRNAFLSGRRSASPRGQAATATPDVERVDHRTGQALEAAPAMPKHRDQG